MKSNFLLLTKVNLLGIFDFNKKNKQEKSSMKRNIIIFSIIALLIIAYSAFMSFTFNLALKETYLAAGAAPEDLKGIYFTTTILFDGLISMLVLFTSMTSVKNIFTGKDYDLLKSLPVKNSDIIASKLVTLYLTEVMYGFAALAPNAIVNFIYEPNYKYLLIGLLSILFVPAIPLLIGSIIAVIISFISDRFKIANILSIIFYLGIFSLSFFASRLFSSKEAMMTTTNFFKYLNPTIPFLEKAFAGNSLYLLLFVGCALAALTVLVLFLALSYDTIHDLVSSLRANNEYKRKELKASSPISALIKNEFKRVGKSKMMLLNCLSPAISVVAVSILMLFTSKDLILANANISNYIHEYGYVIAVLYVFFAGISCPATFLISIEGKSFWMVKTFPISYHKYLTSKYIISVLLTTPFVLISSCIMAFALPLNVYSKIMLILISVTFSLAVNMFGLLMNLLKPKFKWYTEQEVFKNSSSVVLTMLIDLVITIIFSGVIIGFTFINKYLASIGALALSVGMLIALYSIIHKNAIKWINNYENF